MKTLYIGLALAFFTVLLFAGFTHSVPRNATKQTTLQTLQAPQAKSKIKGVDLDHVRLSADGQWVEFVVVNNTVRPLMSVTVRSGANSKVINAFADEILIMPGQSYDKSLFDVNHLEDGILTITAVVYEGGEIVGTKRDAAILHHMKQRKAEGKAPQAVKSKHNENLNQN
jgi:hypothetical protein